MKVNRSDERTEFLGDILVTAIENYGYGQFATEEYDPGANLYGPNPDAYAVIRFDDQEDSVPSYRVDLDTIAHGIQVIKDAEMRDAGDGRGERVLFNKSTGERLMMSRGMRKRILDANRDYDLAGEIDVIDALAILEIALFGKVVYA